MLRFLVSVLLMSCLSGGMAEDAPLPLDHADAVAVSEERRVSSKKITKRARGQHVIQTKKHKAPGKKGKQVVKPAKKQRPAHAPSASKGKVGSKKASKKR